MKTLLSICTGILLTVTCSAKTAFDGVWYVAPAWDGARWLNVDMEATPPKVDVLWEVGGVEPATDVRLSEDGKALHFSFPWDYWFMTTPRILRENLGTFRMSLRVGGERFDGDLQCIPEDKDGKPLDGNHQYVFPCKRGAPMPPAPDVGALKFGDPITLFDGKTLNGWRLATFDGVSKDALRHMKGWSEGYPKDVFGWSVKDGILINTPKLENLKDGKEPLAFPLPPQFGNIRTDREFEDFRLTLEVRLPKGGNSGIYLRGRYEVQVTDSFGRPPSAGMIGAVYSRIVPTENAANPAGEWQTFDITFADRHMTVILNGKKVVDNQPAGGCTGGALTVDDTQPGPIYFQGDHTSVEYRNIKLYPRIKE